MLKSEQKIITDMLQRALFCFYCLEDNVKAYRFYTTARCLYEYKASDKEKEKGLFHTLLNHARINERETIGYVTAIPFECTFHDCYTRNISIN